MQFRKYLPVIILVASSLLAHFIFFGYPNSTVFDEVHFGKFISGYFTGQYFFDIHPPLAKLLISGMGKLGGFEPGFSFANIGDKYQDNAYLWLRFLPTLAGALLPIVLYFLAKQLKFSNLSAFFLGLFAILENSLLVQSRFILLDSLLLLFGFAGLLFYFISQKRSSFRFLVLSIISLSFAFSVKWTGATFLAIVVFLEIYKGIKAPAVEASLHYGVNKIKTWLSKLLFFIGIPLAIYFLIFWTHFALLPLSGPGDAFMTPEFQKTLIGNPYASNTDIQSVGVTEKFIQLNEQMYKSNKTLTAQHPYSSKWYTWPFMVRGIYFWNASAGDAKIYLLGNPFIYWASILAVVWLLMRLISKTPFYQNNKETAVFLAGAFLLNLLPFIFIGRVMFLYHYFTALIFAIMALVFLIDKLAPKTQKTVFTALTIIFALSFIWFTPLTYGKPPLDPHASNARFWFESWR